MQLNAPRLIGCENRRLAGLDHMARTPHGRRRVHREALAHHQPVEQHADGREMLLDGGGPMHGHLLDIGGNIDRASMASKCRPFWRRRALRRGAILSSTLQLTSVTPTHGPPTAGQ